MLLDFGRTHRAIAFREKAQDADLRSRAKQNIERVAELTP